jgi:predicted PurR-regulated permease PerM
LQGELQGESQGESQGETSAAALPNASDVLGAVTRTLNIAFGIVGNTLLIIAVGVFLAANPRQYRDGVAALFPIRRRERVVEIMNRMGRSMFNWLIGQFFAMVISGTGIAIVLWLLGVPMAFMIGVITGLLVFVPNLGALIALLLALLMAISQGPMTMIWVTVAYLAVQLVETNVITPLIQQERTSIPPALLLATQVLMGAALGFAGLLAAPPLLAAVLVLVREVWIRDVLGDESVAAEQS